MLLGGGTGVENCLANAGGFALGVRGELAPDKKCCEMVLEPSSSDLVASGLVSVGVDCSDPSPRETVSGRKRDAMITLCAGEPLKNELIQ